MKVKVVSALPKGSDLNILGLFHNIVSLYNNCTGQCPHPLTKARVFNRGEGENKVKDGERACLSDELG